MLKSDINLIESDCFSSIKTIPTKSIDLVLTSPPYNTGKEYESKISLDNYLGLFRLLIPNILDKLKDTGSICWQTGNYIDKKEVYPLDIYFYKIFKEFGFFLRNRIVWHFGHGLHASKRFSGRYETILWFSKTDDYKFNLDRVRIPSKYPNKKYFKGPKHGQLSCNPLGKNPSDVWEVLNFDFDHAFWDIPNVKSNHPEKTEHPCQFPIELAERCILALTDEGDTVLDPFSGAGSTLLASQLNNRKSIGIEKEKKYIEITKERIQQLQNGTLGYRQLGTTVHKPKTNAN